MGAVSVAGLETIVAVFFSTFTTPTAEVFLTLVRRWVLCLGRPAIALLRRRGVDSVFRLHQSRKADFRKGRRLGRQDRLVEWHKGPRPRWMSRREFLAVPDTMVLRLVRFACAVPGWRTERITVVTTLLDPEAYPARDLADP